MQLKTFSKHTFRKYCNILRRNYESIERIHEQYSFPPYWKRENCFESLCKTIIEQQVSLASAKSSFNRLKKYTVEITPLKLSILTEEEYKACDFTRQKTRYLKLLSEKIIHTPDFFSALENLSDQDVKKELCSLKGIGHWTSNVYSLVALNRINIYPDLDVALISSIAYEAFDHEKIDNEKAKKYIAQFHPLQSIACCYYYHAYIIRKKIKFIP